MTDRLRVRTLGADAAATLSCLPDGTRGRIVAVFGRVFYVGIAGRMLCIAGEAVEPGPLTLVTDAPGGTDWRRLGLAPGRGVVKARDALTVAGPGRIGLADAPVWQPEPVRATAFSDGLARMRALLPEALGAEGLGGFLAGETARTREARAAAPAIAQARQWLAGATLDTGWAGALVGLGPGLTPSGDDYLGGMMIGLHGIGQGERAQMLWAEIAPLAGRRTNAISVALMDAAARGTGNAGLHRAIAAVLGDGDLKQAMDGLDRIGHSSGWDAFAGVVAALESRPVPSLRDAA